jgi:hypothetical protein
MDFVGAPGATRTFAPFARATSKGPGTPPVFAFIFSFIDLCHKRTFLYIIYSQGLPHALYLITVNYRFY